ncbi:hypothetical protein HMPREF1326_00539 [Akkermansia sp. KLE1605]|nr:hypothetical protein HMPREF1326_00539 [Akkermansia sp. KLE1605]
MPPARPCLLPFPILPKASASDGITPFADDRKTMKAGHPNAGSNGSGGMETFTKTALGNPLKKLSIHGRESLERPLARHAASPGRKTGKTLIFSPSAPKFPLPS